MLDSPRAVPPSVDSAGMRPARSNGGTSKRLLRQLARWAPALGWMAVIYRLSAVPGSDLPGRYSTLAHFVTYAILGGLLLLAFDRRHSPGEAVAIAVILASLYAVTDEYHQSFVPMRMPDVADWGVDTLGSWFGAWAALAISRNLPPFRRGADREAGPQ